MEKSNTPGSKEIQPCWDYLEPAMLGAISLKAGKILEAGTEILAANWHKN